MSGGDEMRAQKITFISSIELSLKTALNSVLSGERRVARRHLVSALHADSVRHVRTRV